MEMKNKRDKSIVNNINKFEKAANFSKQHTTDLPQR